MQETSIPLVIAGIGFLTVYYNPMNLRAGGFVLLSLGIGMSFIALTQNRS